MISMFRGFEISRLRDFEASIFRGAGIRYFEISMFRGFLMTIGYDFD